MVCDLRCSQWWWFIMWFELGHRIVWYIHGYKCFEAAFCVCLQRPTDDGRSRSRPSRLCWTFRLHGSITEKTTISNLNIIHFSCIMSLCYRKLFYMSQAICSHAMEHYTEGWAEMCQIEYNVNVVYCIISVCSCLEFCNF